MQLIEHAFDLGAIASLVVDGNGQIRLANKMAEQLFLYNRDELIGASINLVIPKVTASGSPNAILPFIAAMKVTHTACQKNFIGVAKDRSQRSLNVALKELHADGEDLVLCAILDYAEASVADQRFRAVVESAPNGMIMVDEHGVIVLINRMTKEMFGYEREELLGADIGQLVPESVQAAHVESMQAYGNRPHARGMGVGRALFGRRKDGSLFPVEIGLCPIKQEGGMYVVGAIVDISERHEAERQLHEKNEELEEFAYRTSHDLRAPLLSINGLLDCIVDDLKEGDLVEVHENAGRIQSLSSKLVSLVEDMLVLARTDQEHVCEVLFDFNQYIADAREKFAYLMERNQVALEGRLHHERGLPGDPRRMVQVLDNLISNGMKYADTEKPNRFVELHTEEDAAGFYISVKDNGSGIAPEHQEQIFEMFKRFHQGAESGSGLGLYIVRKHLAKMDGRISLESSDEGSTFTVSFPWEKTAKH